MRKTIFLFCLIARIASGQGGPPMLGHEIHSGDNQSLALIGYFGVQFVY
ncbi:MAG: hypothetical protein M3Q46_01560 [Verrucomicrobiota bacterium]|nr:hypothetical protein [Verrucomicrobiota bacterium]